MSMSSRDPGQVLKASHNETTNSLRVEQISGALVTDAYDEIDLTYVPAGNGAGQVETATYKLAGLTIATLTLSYNGSNQLISVVKS